MPADNELAVPGYGAERFVIRHQRANVDQWVQQGMPWWAAQTGIQAPKDWDPAGQLKALNEQ